MKTRFLLLATPAVFLLGFFSGRGTSPDEKSSEPEDQIVRSTRSSRKTAGGRKHSGNASFASAGDIAGLLKLIDPKDSFGSSTRLRGALGDLSAGQLESLILELASKPVTSPGHQTLHLSLLNHLIARNPQVAFDLVLNHDDPSFRASHLATVMQGLARQDGPAAHQALGQIEDQRLRSIAQNVLLSSNADASPADLLALLEAGGNASHASAFPVTPYNPWQWGSGIQSYPMGYPVLTQSHFPGANESILGQLARKDLSSAESYARGIENPHQRNNALVQIANSLATEDPVYALEWARNQESETVRNQAISGIVATLAASDPARAATMINEIQDYQQRSTTINSVVSNWANRDPNAALAWVENLPPSPNRINAFSMVAQQLIRTDPQAAIEVAENLPGSAGQNLLPNLVSQWATDDFSGARDWIVSQQDPVRLRHVLGNVLGTWTQKDPAGAAAFIAQTVTDFPGSRHFSNHLTHVGSHWGASDRDAALAWANSLGDDSQRAAALSGIHGQWAGHDPEGAAQHLHSITDPDQRRNLMNGIASNWASRDPDAARTWLSTLGSEDRMTAGTSIISAIQNQHPQDAAQLYNQLSREAGNNEDLTRQLSGNAAGIVSQWVNQDPMGAAEWASQITSENERAGAYRNLSSQWAAFDPVGTSQWLDSLPAGTPRDRAVSSFVDRVREADPATAFEWASTIADENTRVNSYRNAVYQWREVSPETAREAISASDLSPERRQDLLRLVP